MDWPGITTGSDGNLWFTETSANQNRHSSDPTTQSFTQLVTIPTAKAAPTATSRHGPDGNIWFIETSANKIGARS